MRPGVDTWVKLLGLLMGYHWIAGENHSSDTELILVKGRRPDGE